MFTLLFTAIGKRVQLVKEFQASFRRHGIEARIIGADAHPELAPAGYFADTVYRIPLVRETGYFQRIMEICHQEDVNMVIPLYEPEFAILDRERPKFEAGGILLLLSCRETLEICIDKYRTYHFFASHGFDTPQTWLAEQPPESPRLPLFMKPRTGMGSVGARPVYATESINEIACRESGMILQEYVTGTEFTLDALTDFQGRVLSVTPRERLEVKAGEVSKTRTVARDDLIRQGKAIVEELGGIGPLTLQCIDDGQAVRWIEINPRFGGGVPLTIRAGVDYPYLLYRCFRGEDVEPVLGEYQTGLTMIRYDEAIYF